jgi:hypothetical protein
MAFSDPSLSAQFKLGLKLIERPGICIKKMKTKVLFLPNFWYE